MKCIPILIFFFLTNSPSYGDEPRISLGQQVNQAIKAGVDYLKKEQKPEGHYNNPEDQYAVGEASLCMLALLKSGVSYKDPVIQKILGFMKYKPYTRTYSAAVRIMAYEALRDKDKVPAILTGAAWLADQFRQIEGLWAYPEHGSDLSNTQYAVLGLWTAERHGYKIPKYIWPTLTKSVLEHQRENGGFGYHPSSEPTGSMTTAGLFVLTLCRDKLKKEPELKSQVKQALKQGWAFMEKRFSAKGNPQGDHIFTRDHFFYYLYGLERCCALDNRQKLNGADWYKEGAKELVDSQKDNGSWGGVRETCFALLFLRKSTFTTVKKAHKSNLNQARGEPSGQAKKPKGEVPFLRHWLLLGPFENPKEAAFNQDLIKESQAAPKAGKSVKRLKWTPHRSLGHFIHLDQVYSKEKGLAYAFTRLKVQEDVEATVYFGSHDGAKILLDGKEIFNHPYKCGDGPDHHGIPVFLKKGAHTLLVKVMQINWDWKFALRICDKKGDPIPGLICHLDPEEALAREVFDSTSVTLSPFELYHLIPLDKKLKLDFKGKEDLDRLYVESNNHPTPLVNYCKKKKGEKRPKKGPMTLTFKVRDSNAPVQFMRRVKVPSKRYNLKVRLAALPHNEEVTRTDFFIRFGVFDPEDGFEGGILWYEKQLISCDGKDQYQEFRQSLAQFGGKEVLVFLKCSAGGTVDNDWYRESGCLDEFSVVTGH